MVFTAQNGCEIAQKLCNGTFTSTYEIYKYNSLFFVILNAIKVLSLLCRGAGEKKTSCKYFILIRQTNWKQNWKQTWTHSNEAPGMIRAIIINFRQGKQGNRENCRPGKSPEIQTKQCEKLRQDLWERAHTQIANWMTTVSSEHTPALLHPPPPTSYLADSACRLSV